MNFFKFHLGDYAQATQHLSFVEDAAYLRLLRKYYAQEKPLPLDEKQVQRLIGARTKEEKNAVTTVLQEFFFKMSDGWHNARCDEEIAKFLDEQPKSQEKKENDKERQKRARERRKALFNQLFELGINMPFNATTEQLQEELSRVTSSDTSQYSHEEVTHHVTRDNTANHKPESISQNPLTNIKPTVDDDCNIPSVEQTPPQQQSAKILNLNQNSNQPFTMHADWTPSESFEGLAKIAGFVFTDRLPVAELGEFKTYWLTHEHQAITQGQWEHKFIQNLISHKVRKGAGQ